MYYIKGENRAQAILFPESLDEYISPDNPVRIIDEYVRGLDLEKLKFTHSTPSFSGRPPYHPTTMIKLYLYGYLIRIRSSRRLEAESKRNVELMWLLEKLSPDFKTIADFRKENKKALVYLFRDFTRLCNTWQLYGKELIAIDGTKFRACNSKRNNYSAKKLTRHIRYIDEKIESYLAELDEQDKLEEVDRKPDTAEINKRIEELKKRKLKYQGYQKMLTDTGSNEISTTDPDSRLMATNNNSVEVSYNVQASVDSEHKLIADFKVITKPNDLGELAPMAVRASKILNKSELTVVADKGYYRAQDLKTCSRKGITTYVAKQTYSNGTGDKDYYLDKFTYCKEDDYYLCPEGNKLYYYRTRKKNKKIIGKTYRNPKVCATCPVKARCTRQDDGRTIFRHIDQDILDVIDKKTQENLKTYKQRQMIAEHPFGTIKRAWGASYFLTRGRHSVSAEIALSFLSYNLRRVINILGFDEIMRRLKANQEAIPL